MHEASIAQAIIDTIEQECKRYSSVVLTKVKIRIGKATGVLPEALSFAFEASKKGTIAAKAVLEIVETPLKGRCQGCKIEFESTDGVFLVCPQCGKGWVDCISGRELEIIELEMEDLKDENQDCS